MGQYTSRITNPNQTPSSNYSITSPSTAANNSTTSASSSQSSTHSSNASNPIGSNEPHVVHTSSTTFSRNANSNDHNHSHNDNSSRMNSLRRRRSSTNYTTAHLPNPRRRRLPRLNETIRFWNRRLSQPNNNSNESLTSYESGPSNHQNDQEDQEDVDLNVLHDISHSHSLGSRSSANTNNNNNNSNNNNYTDPLDIAGLADLASDIFSPRTSSSTTATSTTTANGPPNRDNSSGNGGSGITGFRRRHRNHRNDDNSMSFEHQTQMLSRLLEIAATSTVSNLMGSTQVNGRRFDNTSRLNPQQSVSNDSFGTIGANGDDSNFQEFVNALRHGLLTNELTNRYSDVETNYRDNMTFFRAFRFDSEGMNIGSVGNNDGDDDASFENSFIGGTTSSIGTQTSESTSSNGTSGNGNGNENDVETPNVPVMIIGVRSVQPNVDALSLNQSTTTSTPVQTSSQTTTDTNEGSNGSLNHSHDHHQPADTSTSSGSASTTNNSNPQRSWVIFVMGNTFAWNHPLLSAPSLMSENPTYEDLLNLQELIGQVKPQVTTREELFKHDDQLFEIKTTPITTATETASKYPILQISEEQSRCHICLSEYEDSEIIRKLTNCGHYYHQGCLDNWLLNGKNNCPLCRSKGIVNPGEEQEQKC